MKYSLFFSPQTANQSSSPVHPQVASDRVHLHSLGSVGPPVGSSTEHALDTKKQICMSGGPHFSWAKPSIGPYFTEQTLREFEYEVTALGMRCVMSSTV
jgi:hypothetical protein